MEPSEKWLMGRCRVPVLHRGLGIVGIGCLITQPINLVGEVVDRVVVTVDAGKSQVCDGIKITQRLEDGHPDLVGRNGSHAAGAKPILDTLPEHREIRVVDRPALASFPHTGNDLLSIEEFLSPIAFEDGQLHALDRREPAAADRALSATTDRRTVLADS